MTVVQELFFFLGVCVCLPKSNEGVCGPTGEGVLYANVHGRLSMRASARTPAGLYVVVVCVDVCVFVCFCLLRYIAFASTFLVVYLVLISIFCQPSIAGFEGVWRAGICDVL